MAVRILNEGTPSLVKLTKLKNHPNNPRKGSVDDIAESFSTNGFWGYLVVQKSTGFVLIGNHRLKAARKLKMPEVPVVYVDVDDEEAERICLADNRHSDLGTYDDSKLADMLSRLLDTDLGLRGLGYTEGDLDRLLENLQGPAMEDSPNHAGDDEEVPPGGPVDTDGLPSSPIRQYQLFFRGEAFDKFCDAARDLRDVWGMENVTDTIVRAVEVCLEKLETSAVKEEEEEVPA